jgi:hypothetical protein
MVTVFDQAQEFRTIPPSTTGLIMQPITHVSLVLEENGTSHDDLVLRCGDRQWRCDSYYLAIDPGISREAEEGDNKTRLVLQRLTDQWTAAVKSLVDGGIAFLPYDLSDQCTAWLRCRAQGDLLEIHHGWSEIEGYSFLPSDVGPLLHEVPDFKADHDGFLIRRDVFLESIRGRPAAP